jgi:hypothetical protein
VSSKKKFARLSAAVDRMDTDPSVRQQVNVVPQRATQRIIPDAGMTIRGLAGPFAVMAQNFAPGTTAADVESAMTPVGGEMLSCEVVKTHPFMIVEMVFASREGGERVIETFNNKTVSSCLYNINNSFSALFFSFLGLPFFFFFLSLTPLFPHKRPTAESSKSTPSQAATSPPATPPPYQLPPQAAANRPPPAPKSSTAPWASRRTTSWPRTTCPLARETAATTG